MHSLWTKFVENSSECIVGEGSAEEHWNLVRQIWHHEETWAEGLEFAILCLIFKGKDEVGRAIHDSDEEVEEN